MLPHQQAGTILAQAFHHYPLMLHAFDGSTEAQRGKGLQQLYHHCTAACATYGYVNVTPDKQGAIICLPGNSFPLGLWREVRSGMALIPVKLGIKTTLRLVNHDAVGEGWIKKNAGSKMGYIWCLGVLDSARGKGYSRLLIDQSIAHMKQQGLNEFWLKTEDPKNVIIYQKLGFDLIQELNVPSSGLKSWVMKRG